MPDFVYEVFVPSGTPKHTYVKRVANDNEKKLSTALALPQIVVAISGPSKTGKTALVDTIITSEFIIPVTGQPLKSPNDLWQAVMRWIGGPEEIIKIKERTYKAGLVGKTSAEAGILFAKAKAEGELNGGAEFKNSTSEFYGVDFFEAVVSEIKDSPYVVFLDDFHYIEEQAQRDIARSIKAIAERGVRVCVASVPHKSDDMVRANDELSGRVYAINSSYWTIQELEIIGKNGFPIMGLDIAPNIIRRLAVDSLGSPQLMQSLCLNLCLVKDVKNKVITTSRTDITEEDYSFILDATSAQTDYSRVVEKLHTGAKERGTQRKEFIFNDGSTGDVYRSILLAIVQNPPQLDFKYDEIMDRIKSVCAGESPTGSSVQLALIQMHEIAINVSKGTPVLEWDDDKLQIVNPYFMFYMRSSSKLHDIYKRKSGMVL